MKRWPVIICLSLLSILFVYPSAFIYPNDTLPDNNDDRLIAYIIGQVQQNLINYRPLYYGTFFAPEKNTLTYSDPFITSAVITLPFRAVTNSPIQIFNIAYVLGFLLTILSCFILFGYLFRNDWISALATILFNFSGFHLAYYPHTQLFFLWPLLLSLYFFLRYLREDRPLFLTLFFFTTTLQMAESLFPVYLLFFATSIIYLSGFPTKSKFISDVKHVLPRLIPFLFVWAFLLFPYLQLRLTFPEAFRSIRDTANFSLSVDQIFTFFHSWTVIILLIFAFLSFSVMSTQARSSKIFPTLSWKIIFFFSLVMSLGPVLKVFGKTFKIFSLPIPLPYTAFYYLFPGFTGFRTPGRFIVLALLASVILIGYALIPIVSGLKTGTKIVFLFLISSFLFLEADLPLKAFPVNINMHPVYRQVKALPENAIILELPIKLWAGPNHEIESIRSLYSLEHHHRRFNGFSGFASNTWIDLVIRIQQNGLDQDNLTRLHLLGITHVIQNNILSPLPD
ncbi:MAG: hypothetical protein ACD_61C00167G0002 [uncultured bacterium]|nr:MAG: hypothetical protein ACD_61C00167G0002 [uncultured bacterium]